MTVSRTSSLSSADNGADAGIGGAGDLDLGDFTRLAPLLLASTISLFATRILALRGADTNTPRVRRDISWKNRQAFAEAGTHRQ